MKAQKQDRELSRLRPAPNSEGKTFKFALSAVCKKSNKRLKQTDRKIVWKQEELFRLSSDQFRSIFEVPQRFFEVLEESLLLSRAASQQTSPYWTSCSGRRNAGELLLAVEVLTSSFDFGSCFPRSTFRSGICRAEENIDLVSKLRRLPPGKEKRSAEENLERPKTDASGFIPARQNVSKGERG